MSLNHGIQKYRESAKSMNKTSSEKKTLKAETPNKSATSAPAKKAAAKAPAAKTPAAKSAASKKEDKSEKLKTKARGNSKASADDEEDAEEIMDAVATIAKKGAAAAPIAAGEGAAVEEGDAALQKELEEEMQRDAVQTSSLVKEDYSPVNSTRDRLVVEYAPLIKYIAQKIAARLPTNIELDDLISSGVIGLMDAIEKYDASRDNKFKTYAEFRIRGAILDELRAQDWVPRSVREKAKVLERCYARIEQQKGRQATDDEVCADLGISQDEYHDMLNQVRSVSLLSFDDVTSFSKADKRALHGFGDGSNSKSPTPFSEVNVAVLKRMIAEAINDLPEKQRLVLSLYYYEDLNLKEIGRVLDVTESRVSQLHTQAILRLKGKLRNHWDDFVTLFGG